MDKFEEWWQQFRPNANIQESVRDRDFCFMAFCAGQDAEREECEKMIERMAMENRCTHKHTQSIGMSYAVDAIRKRGKK